ncbi:olfactory receptor 10A7-like [Tiliqua scincoides]|uniref:olfactory receptor 10A7-like n=1 Tax=Tiliqua scincoides TaxID=71010 RepID=UPI003461B4DD
MEDSQELQWRNYTEVTEFILQGFLDFQEFQVLLFAVILVVYGATIVGNSLIIAVIRACSTLHTPMYFFLQNLSFLELCYTSVTVPKMLADIMMDSRSISYLGCLVQMYSFALSGSAECLLLTAMAYDRYVAICHPLHYFLTMSKSVCVGLVAGSWLSGIIVALIQAMLMVRLRFCQSNTIDHFFCDIVPLIKLACGDTSVNQLELLVVIVFVGVIPFMLILVSYVRIIFTILTMSSAKGRCKVFSTCSSHLMVVSLFFGSSCAMYLGNASTLALGRRSNKFLSLLYAVVTPMLNPVIYSLRNKEVKGALKSILSRLEHGSRP